MRAAPDAGDSENPRAGGKSITADDQTSKTPPLHRIARGVPAEYQPQDQRPYPAGMLVALIRASPDLTDVADWRTITWPGLGFGVGTWRITTTSGGP